jgi:uncharacterized membrane protein YphA (DoxX/SURF4 family)
MFLKNCFKFCFSFRGLVSLIFLFISVTTIQSAQAHEVYVLDSQVAHNLITDASPNPFDAIKTSGSQFLLWTFIAIITVSTVFLVSISRTVENIFDPILFTIKRKFGFIVIRITIGLALFASGYYHSLFGPELPLEKIYGSYAELLSIVLMVAGACILFGFLTRVMGTIALLIAFGGFFKYGWYIFTYSNYLGDIIFVAFLGAHVLSLDKHVLKWHGIMGAIERFVEKYAFLILRVTFGTSLIYASVYAKFLHSNLALQTIADYHLTNYFHVEPLFIVLGASIIEVLIGIFIIIGFEMRFTALFLMVFLSLSLWYFGESVWPHIVLFGGALALFVHGYDKYTIEGFFFKNAKHEPVL